jgi:hypothetical protein
MDNNIGNWLLNAFMLTSQAECNKAESVHISSENSQTYNDLWVVDGGATRHFSGHKTDFCEYNDINPTLIHGMNLLAVGAAAPAKIIWRQG